MTELGEAETLIQCVGSPFRHDDGVGLFIARELQGRISPRHARVESHWGEGTALMAGWPGRRHVFVVDAACSGAKPGTVHRIDACRRAVPRRMLYYSTHRFGLAEAVEMARSLNRLPGSLWVYGIEGKNFRSGEGLSPAVESAARLVIDELAQRVAP